MAAPPHTATHALREQAMMMRKQNFILGNEQPAYGTQSGNAHVAYPVGTTFANNRAELKTKMQTAQFTMGNQNCMSGAQTSYTAGVDMNTQKPVDSHNQDQIKEQTTALKSSNFVLGTDKPKNVSEAASVYLSGSKNAHFAQQARANAQLKQKMQTDNFTWKEQEKGGRDQAYFVTSNRAEHKSLGNPNAIRSFIDDSQREFNRNSRI